MSRPSRLSKACPRFQWGNVPASLKPHRANRDLVQDGIDAKTVDIVPARFGSTETSGTSTRCSEMGFSIGARLRDSDQLRQPGTPKVRKWHKADLGRRSALRSQVAVYRAPRAGAAQE